MNSLNDIWNSVLDALRTDQMMTPTSLNTWFSDCEPLELRDNQLVLYSPTDFTRDIIMDRFSPYISEVLSDLFSTDMGVTVLAGEKEREEFYGKQNAELPEEVKNITVLASAYSFNNFVEGPSNKYAYAASIAVAGHLGELYNPLFIYGNSGLGKTHLLMAIGNYVHIKNPFARIVYVKGDDFTNDMVHSIQTGSTAEFRQRYRQADLLLMDDIQFIAGKQQTQEEFFHTFNSLYEAGKQIVVTSDRPPMEMAKLEDRIRTRLESGLMADVQPPDLETRIAIIRNKAAQLGMPLSDEVVECIAENITSNVRQIEGVVHKLTAYKNLMDDEITVATVKRAIKDVAKDGVNLPTAEVIISETARYYGIPESALIGQSKQKTTATARQVSMYLCRTLISMVLTDIGEKHGGRNHATVLASIR